ncbi:MAG: basic secretory protein-like protein [Luteolibacter sp.]
MVLRRAALSLLVFLTISPIHAEPASPSQPAETEKKPAAPVTVKEGAYTYILESGPAPDLSGWMSSDLAPVIKEWYPKIVAMLPGEGFTATTTVTFRFQDDMKGVPAWAAGNVISLNADWFRRNLKGEARGCVVHEMVHVVQHYGRGKNPVPGWVIEGIPDYIRWFLYEPQTKGAEITRGNLAAAKYDGNYRISANFIDWVIRTKDKDLLASLNAACREGKYTEDVWKERTGTSLPDLGAEWKKAHEERLAK